jgi:hypothetical protein
VPGGAGSNPDVSTLTDSANTGTIKPTTIHTAEINIFSNMVPTSLIELKPTSVETRNHSSLLYFKFIRVNRSN